MNFKFLLLFASFTLLLFTQKSANATPILLASIDAEHIGSTGYSGPLRVAESMVFTLGFKDFDRDETLQDCSGYIGCEKRWSIGETGSFDFDVNNTVSATFQSIAEKLTNGIVEADPFTATGEFLTTAIWTYYTDGFPASPAESRGRRESRYNIPVNANIEFIRLTVTENSILTTTVNGRDDIDYRFVGSFDLWGTQAATDIPAPGGPILLFAGLVIMGLRNKRTNNPN